MMSLFFSFSLQFHVGLSFFFLRIMYENCWENLSLQTERQFVTFVSSLKRGGEKLQHCLIGRFTGDKWFAGGKKWIVQSGLNQSGLVRSLLSLLNHPDWSGGLTSEHCFPQGGSACAGIGSQIYFWPETKELINKKLNRVSSHVKWSPAATTVR